MIHPLCLLTDYSVKPLAPLVYTQSDCVYAATTQAYADTVEVIVLKQFCSVALPIGGDIISTLNLRHILLLCASQFGSKAELVKVRTEESGRR